MNIYFVDPEPSERAYLQTALKDHTLHFLTRTEDVPKEAQLVSVFIDAKIDSAFLDSHPALQLVTTRSTTFDHIDLEACARRRITVAYVPSYGNQTVAEHTFALILALARRLREAMESLHLRNFSYEELRGFELRGKTLGVIGAGRIGSEVLRLGHAFGMTCLACDIQPRKNLARRFGFRYVPLPELLRRSDVISLHAPVTPATHHLLDREAFASCRRGVVIINTARGSLIDAEALIAAIDAGIVAGVGLDVLDDERVMRGGSCRVISTQIVDRLHTAFGPAESRERDSTRVNELKSLILNETLLSKPNVIFTPHIAFNSEEAIQCINDTTADNIKAFLLGEPVNVLTGSGTSRIAKATGGGSGTNVTASPSKSQRTPTEKSSVHF
jgi:D-lactate dehydrogenase